MSVFLVLVVYNVVISCDFKYWMDSLYLFILFKGYEERFDYMFCWNSYKLDLDNFFGLWI